MCLCICLSKKTEEPLIRNLFNLVATCAVVNPDLIRFRWRLTFTFDLEMVNPQMVTHPSTKWTQCRVTTLIETNALPLSQTATTRLIATALWKAGKMSVLLTVKCTMAVMTKLLCLIVMVKLPSVVWLGTYKVSLSAVQRAALVRTGTLRQLRDRQRPPCLLRGRTQGYLRRCRWGQLSCDRFCISEVTSLSSLLATACCGYLQLIGF